MWPAFRVCSCRSAAAPIPHSTQPAPLHPLPAHSESCARGVLPHDESSCCSQRARLRPICTQRCAAARRRRRTVFGSCPWRRCWDGGSASGAAVWLHGFLRPSVCAAVRAATRDGHAAAAAAAGAAAGCAAAARVCALHLHVSGGARGYGAVHRARLQRVAARRLLGPGRPGPKGCKGLPLRALQVGQLAAGRWRATVVRLPLLLGVLYAPSGPGAGLVWCGCCMRGPVQVQSCDPLQPSSNTRPPQAACMPAGSACPLASHQPGHVWQAGGTHLTSLCPSPVAPAPQSAAG